MALKDSENFSCDLVSEAKRHLLFLKTVHSLGVTLVHSFAERPSKESLCRYYKLWLPLVGLKSKDIIDKGFPEGLSLIPPPDIAWLWHCHRLAPFNYAEYIKQQLDIFDKTKLLNLSAPFALQIDPNSNFQSLPSVQSDSEGKFLWINHSCAKDVEETRRLWSIIYPEEAFFTLPSSQHQSLQPVNDAQEENDGFLALLNSYNLLDAAKRQSNFLWQVLGQQYSDDDFLHEGVRNYHKFILLKSIEAGKKQLIVPTCQIDLIWHTHILFSITKYDDDCIKIVGLKLNHDDSIDDRHEGGLLDVSFQSTKKLWETTYGESYSVPGGMYPGEPPATFFLPEQLYGTDNKATAASQSEIHSKWTKAGESTLSGLPGFTVSLSHDSSYIFGYSSAFGEGYYHISTKEAYKIIEKELKIEINKARGSLGCCRLSISLFSCKSSTRIQLKELGNLLSAVRYQIYEVDAPAAQLVLPTEFLSRIQKPREIYESGGKFGSMIPNTGASPHRGPLDLIKSLKSPTTALTKSPKALNTSTTALTKSPKALTTSPKTFTTASLPSPEAPRPMPQALQSSTQTPSGGYGAGSGRYGASSGGYGTNSGRYGASSGGYGANSGRYGAGAGRYNTRNGSYHASSGQYNAGNMWYAGGGACGSGGGACDSGGGGCGSGGEGCGSGGGGCGGGGGGCGC